MKRSHLKVWFAVVIALLAGCIFALAACSSKGDADAGSGSTSIIVSDSANRKLVYTVDIDIDCDDVSKARDEVLSKAKELGGYVQRQYENGGKTLNYSCVTVRIPTEKLDEYVQVVSGKGKLTSKSVRVADITTDYVHATARKQALEARKQFLEDLLTDSSITVSERLLVTNEISSVQTELQALELELSDYDSLVDYSTVTVNISGRTVEPGAIMLIIFVALIIAALSAGVVVLAVFLVKAKHKNA